MNRWKIRSQSGLALAGLFLFTSVSVTGQAVSKHRVTLDDLESLRSVSFLQLSPKGDALVYVTGEDMWLVATRPGSLPHKLGKGTVPLWSADGNRLAYYSTESGTNQLWVLDIETGHAEQVTSLEGGIEPDPWTSMVGFTGGSAAGALLYSWSPDGAKLVFPSRVVATRAMSKEVWNSGTGGNTPLVLTTHTPPDWTFMGVLAHDGSRDRRPEEKKGEVPSVLARFNQLFVVEISSKKVSQLTDDDGIYFSPDWSPDGQRVVCASFEGKPQIGWGQSTANIYAFDLGTRKKNALTTGSSYKALPHWSPDGKWIAYAGSEAYSQQSVFVIPSTGGLPINVAGRLGRNVYDFQWLQENKTILIHYADGISGEIARLNIQDGRLEPIGEKHPASRWYVSASRSGWTAWVQSDGPTHEIVRVSPPRASSSYVLLNLNPQIQEWELGVQEVVRWKNDRGDELEGILIKPVGYREGLKYPLIVDAMPETENYFRGVRMEGNQALASRGYAVFFPNARAPHVFLNHYKTETFDHAARGPKGWDVTLDDLTSGVDELIRRGIVDPDRMGLFGFSNGGGVVNYVITRTGRFKCAVSVAGALADWARHVFLKTNSSIPMFAGGLTPWDDPEAYIQLSAVYHVKNVTTPLLLAAGDNDTGFLLDTIEMYNSLRWLGRDVTLLRYPDQGHGFEGAAMKDFWERENAFFDKYLRPEEPPN